MSDDNVKPVIRKRAVPSRRRRDGLLQFARDFTSQNGEDGLLERLFELLPSTTTARYCVDVGAWDGKHLSNTYNLLVHKKWKGVLIEADGSKHAQLKDLHEPLGNVCLNVTVSCQAGASDSLVQLLQQHAPNLSDDFDFLCIDVDGSDYWVLNDVWTNSSYRPKVVCVEFNPTMPDDLVYIPVCSDSIRHGASLSALCELAEQYDYVLVETTLYNAFFVPRSLYQEHLSELVPDTTIEALHEPTMSTQLYQLYDGTLKLWGCRKLLWHRLPISEETIQVLPASERSFPFAPSVVNEETQKADSLLYDTAIDMSAYCARRSMSTAEKEQCAAELWEQLQSDGFALVRGTGISRKLCESALALTHAFLQDADESVRRSCLAKDRARRGYSPMCTENFASLIGEQGPNDLVRKFRVGPTTDENIYGTSSLMQPNSWPTDEWDRASEFKASVSCYYDAVCSAADAVVLAICDGIRANHHELTACIDSLTTTNTEASLAHTSILTLLGYRPGSRHKRKERPPLVAPHTDVGVITFLLFDNGGCASLQRVSHQNDMKEWVDVRLPAAVGDDPIFVVNIGDCLSELTGGTLPSTLHRVIPQTDNSTPRSCLALFVGLDPSQSITMPDGIVLSYEEWRKRRIARAQAVLSTK